MDRNRNMTVGPLLAAAVLAATLVASLSPAAAKGRPAQSSDGSVTGIGRLDGTPGTGMFAFEGVQEDGVVTGVVSRVFVSPGSATPVHERIGHVTCISIAGDRATMNYIVDQTNQAVPVGTLLHVLAHDRDLLDDGVVMSTLDRGAHHDPARCPKPGKSFVGQTPQGEVTIVATD